MPFSLDDQAEGALVQDFATLMPPQTRFEGMLAIGIRSHPQRSTTLWFEIRISEGKIVDVSSACLDKTQSVETERGASVGISASLNTWCETADEGRSGLLSRIAKLEFYVVGDAATYIRYLDVIVDLMELASNTFRSRSTEQ